MRHVCQFRLFSGWGEREKLQSAQTQDPQSIASVTMLLTPAMTTCPLSLDILATSGLHAAASKPVPSRLVQSDGNLWSRIQASGLANVLPHPIKLEFTNLPYSCFAAISEWGQPTNQVVSRQLTWQPGSALKLPHSTALPKTGWGWLGCCTHTRHTFDCQRREPFLWWRRFTFWWHLSYSNGRGRHLV